MRQECFSVSLIHAVAVALHTCPPFPLSLQYIFPVQLQLPPIFPPAHQCDYEVTLSIAPFQPFGPKVTGSYFAVHQLADPFLPVLAKSCSKDPCIQVLVPPHFLDLGSNQSLDMVVAAIGHMLVATVVRVVLLLLGSYHKLPDIPPTCIHIHRQSQHFPQQFRKQSHGYAATITHSVLLKRLVQVFVLKVEGISNEANRIPLLFGSTLWLNHYFAFVALEIVDYSVKVDYLIIGILGQMTHFFQLNPQLFIAFSLLLPQELQFLLLLFDQQWLQESCIFQFFWLGRQPSISVQYFHDRPFYSPHQVCQLIHVFLYAVLLSFLLELSTFFPTLLPFPYHLYFLRPSSCWEMVETLLHELMMFVSNQESYLQNLLLRSVLMDLQG